MLPRFYEELGEGMKKEALIALLEKLPDQAEVVMLDGYDVAMNRQEVRPEVSLSLETIVGYYTKSGHTVWFSKYSSVPQDIEKNVYVLEPHFGE